MLEDALQMLVSVTVANRRANKMETLQEASGRLDALRITLRLSRRLGFVSNGGYQDLSKGADEVGRMLGGWLKYEKPGGESTAGRDEDVARRVTRKRRTGGVRFTMTSPTVERYLRSKLASSDAVVFITVGAFCQTFFEDAVYCGHVLRLAVRNLAAESETEKILTCGIPKAKLEKYIDLLRRSGRDVHVE
jgi:hypothetical protein